jgi:hypothetical protein
MRKLELRKQGKSQRKNKDHGHGHRQRATTANATRHESHDASSFKCFNDTELEVCVVSQYISKEKLVVANY